MSFPTGDSKQDKSARLNAAAVTLQNLNGPGQGCPVVSTTFPLQQKAIDAAKQQLDELQEQARKAGVAEKDKE